MFFDDKVYAANAQGEKLFLLPKMANRHGLITGATGTGKTVTMKVLAESFSDMGVPVFLADVKGDVSDMINGVKEEGFGYLTAGCNASVSAIGMGVAALAVAFIALKKKED